jgi:hypothetical protein
MHISVFIQVAAFTLSQGNGAHITSVIKVVNMCEYGAVILICGQFFELLSISSMIE